MAENETKNYLKNNFGTTGWLFIFPMHLLPFLMQLTIIAVLPLLAKELLMMFRAKFRFIHKRTTAVFDVIIRPTPNARENIGLDFI